MPEPQATTTPNYHLLNAMYNWIIENGGRVYISLPVKYLPEPLHRLGNKDGIIVLNISPSAVGALSIEREYVSFDARFSQVRYDLCIPTDKIFGIFNPDMPDVMSMPLPQVEDEPAESIEPVDPTPEVPKRPTLTVVK